MDSRSHKSVKKFLKLCFWSKYLKDQGILTEQEYIRILTLIRHQYGEYVK